MMGKIQQLLTKKERKVIHDLASKPKVRKKAYGIWKCANAECAEEYYFQPIHCPICTADIKAVKKFKTFLEYPVTKYF